MSKIIKNNVIYAGGANPDNKTIVTNSLGKLAVPIDEITIKVDSSGKLIAGSISTKPVISGNGITVTENTNNYTVDANYDNSTIILNSEGKLKSVSTVVLTNGSAINIDSENKINVLFDNSTVGLDSEGKLKADLDSRVPITTTSTNNSTTIANGDTAITDHGITLINRANSGATSGLVLDTDEVKLGNEDDTGKYTMLIMGNDDSDTVINLVSKIDNNSGAAVTIIPDHILLATAKDTGTLTFNNKNVLTEANIDDDTIKLNSEGNLYTTSDASNKVDIETTSGNKSCQIENDASGVGFRVLNMDSSTSSTIVSNPVGISLDVSNNDLANQSYSKVLLTSSSGMLYYGNYTAATSSTVEVSDSGIALTTDKDATLNNNKIITSADVDNSTVKFNTTNKNIYVPIDNSTIKVNSAGELEADITTKSMVAGNAIDVVENTNDYTISAKYDNSTIVLDSNSKLSVPIDNNTITVASNKLQANTLIDNSTIKKNSSSQIYVPIDNNTIKVNTAGNLIADITTKSIVAGNGIKVTENTNDYTIDTKYDDSTIVLNTSGNLSVPIDNDTIKVNSEGKLVAVTTSSEGYVLKSVTSGDYSLNISQSANTMQTTLSDSSSNKTSTILQSPDNTTITSQDDTNEAIINLEGADIKIKSRDLNLINLTDTNIEVERYNSSTNLLASAISLSDDKVWVRAIDPTFMTGTGSCSISSHQVDLKCDSYGTINITASNQDGGQDSIINLKCGQTSIKIDGQSEIITINFRTSLSAEMDGANGFIKLVASSSELLLDDTGLYLNGNKVLTE